ncbi:NADPH-dependent FMN reductase [Paucibacter sp. KBW04]|uniref:flavodoxin family protein n=1 Tax=Paucibacter sp. KBW04 TaxID=2153361 RepID=UPI000F5747A2|nr:flavodoxin family protein [Paucibacter sp. KBW04]RQO63471.1 NADPH-dependent FMN reductase [Paucibacter sp. KBW04]
MSKIAIVFHSGYGHTQKVAEAVAEGSGGALLAIDAEGHLSEADWAHLAAADAIIFGTPTYMGGPSWQFKKFADASSKIWFSQGWKDKIAAGFSNSASLNGDKFSTLQYLFTLSQQHGMVWTGLGQMPANRKAATRDDLNNLGASIGLLTATPSDASVDEMVAGDLATAKAFGQRVAAVAARWAA